MAEAIRSALLVDYESLHRSLTGGTGDSRLADRAGAWLAAIESGRLIAPKGRRRRLVTKRVYAGPTVNGKQRDSLAAAGFEVIDVGGPDARSSADLHLAMDAVDALLRPEGCDEFVLLTAASDLAPLLARLKASKRLTAIYADATTPAAAKQLADALLDSTDLAIVLSAEESEPSSAPKSAAERAGIEAFARKIHAATNIPLFSPRTFAELFRHLTDEISENGYHFQSTAKNVADRMTGAGRNVNRRQVVFIVKGLALKGHVFSTSDTPARLAEVFREQARYLITNAGMTLDENEELLLNAWFAGATSQHATPAAPKPATPKAAPAPVRARAEPPPPPPPPPPSRASEPISPAPPAERPRPAVRPTATARPPSVRPVELPRSTAKPPAKPAPAATPPAAPVAREEARAVIAARIAGAAKLKPAATRPLPKAAPRPAAPPAPQSARPNNDPLESSILAAIAEAVDVLVEDDNEPTAAPPAPTQRPAAKRPPPLPEEPAQGADSFAEEDDDDAESGDIGDQIQRIIASYNRNRGNE